jgi:hypothetical protein
MNTGAINSYEVTRETWQPMQLRYVGHVGDVMRGSVGTRRDTNPAGNCTGAVGTGQCS